MRRDVSLLAAAVVAAVCAAAFVVVGERHLGIVGFEPVAQLWSIWSVAAAVLTLSTQLWVIGGGPGERRAGWWFMPMALVLVIAFAVFSVTYRYRIELFSSNDLLWPLFAAAIPLGGAGIGFCRGLWAAADRFGGLAWVLGLENVLRLLPALLAAALGLSSRWFGAALLCGYGVVLFWPRDVALGDRKADNNATGSTFAASALAGFFSHVTLSAGPVVMAIGGGSDAETTAVFLALFALRVPVTLLQGLLPRASVYFNGLAAASPLALARAQMRLWIASVALAMFVASLGALVLGPLIGLVFGEDARLARTDYAISSAAGVLGAAVLIGITALAAQNRTRWLAGGWWLPVGMAACYLLTRDVVSVRDIFGSMLFIEIQMAGLYLLVASFFPTPANAPRSG